MQPDGDASGDGGGETSQIHLCQKPSWMPVPHLDVLFTHEVLEEAAHMVKDERADEGSARFRASGFRASLHEWSNCW